MAGAHHGVILATCILSCSSSIAIDDKAARSGRWLIRRLGHTPGPWIEDIRKDTAIPARRSRRQLFHEKNPSPAMGAWEIACSTRTMVGLRFKVGSERELAIRADADHAGQARKAKDRQGGASQANRQAFKVQTAGWFTQDQQHACQGKEIFRPLARLHRRWAASRHSRKPRRGTKWWTPLVGGGGPPPRCAPIFRSSQPSLLTRSRRKWFGKEKGLPNWNRLTGGASRQVPMHTIPWTNAKGYRALR